MLEGLDVGPELTTNGVRRHGVLVGTSKKMFCAMFLIDSNKPFGYLEMPSEEKDLTNPLMNNDLWKSP